LVLPAAARGGDPLFTLHAAGGVAGVGPLTKVGEDWSARLGGPNPALVQGADILSLRRAGVALPPYPESEQVILAGGERLPLDTRAGLRLADEVLSFHPLPPLRPAAGAELRVPLSRVAVLWLGARPGGDPVPRLRQLMQEARARDRVLLRGGDVVEGTVLSLDREGACRVKVGSKQVAVPFGQVAAVAFSTDLLVKARPRGPYGHLVLTGGCRLDLTSASVESEARRLRGKAVFGAAVIVPLADVAALDLRQGRAVYLSDLRPLEYACAPFLGVSWPLTVDASASGRQLCVGGGCHDKGLGMHAKSRVTYDLLGRFERFEATVGLDERTGGRGRVRVEVLLDGTPQALGDGAELTAGQPLGLRVDVSKARRLTLAVHFAGRGGVGADVDWADARLITSARR
jgi:hypothetical protein